jgi:hypothetical protein
VIAVANGVRRVVIAVLVLAAGAAGACLHSAAAARRREAGYESQLAVFSATFKPGTTRSDVENQLRRSGREFRQMCCMNRAPKNAYDDLTQFGSEPRPWYCSAHNVYIGFEFVSTGTHEFPEAHDSDTLKGVQIYHWLEGCL